MNKLRINNKIISEDNKPFIIAEAGVNYYDIAKKDNISNLKAAKLMVKEAALAGADAIKFQIYKAEKLASKYAPAYWDTKKEKIRSQVELFKKFDKLTSADYADIASYAKKCKIIFMATPFDEDAVKLVDKLSPLFKVASADITDFPLLKKIALKRKPIFLSTGASTIKEIKEAVNFIKKNGNNKIALLHCILNYPTEKSKANLFRIKQLKKIFPDYIIGYSGHSTPDEKMLLLTSAYLLGARVIEKHFTLDKSLKGNDHYHAMDPADLRKFVDNINFLQKVIGKPASSEKEYLKNQLPAIKYARRSIVASVDLKKGEKISLDKLAIKRPGIGISPKFLNKVAGENIEKERHKRQIVKVGRFFLKVMDKKNKNRLSSLESMSNGDKKIISHIEGKPDSFQIKIIRIKTAASAKGSAKKVLVTAGDPGSGNALLPVMDELCKDANIEIDVITDGRAQEIIENNFQFEDITPDGNILTVENAIGRPDIILLDISFEMGTETFVTAAFPDVPKVLVEDYYSCSFGFLKSLEERGLPLPNTVCVMDNAAKSILTKKMPALAGRIKATGQPAFDKFAKEGAEKIAKETRYRLGLEASDRLVSFMSTIDGVEKTTEIAKVLSKVVENFYFIFRRHPRDNVRYEDYKKIFKESGVKIIDSEGFTTDEISAASDVVLTTWSTVGIESIYHRKPTVNIIDFRYPVPAGFDFPLVPVRLGASVGIDNIGQLTEILPDLLDKGSLTNKNLRANMKKYYKADGKNAQRVAEVVKKYLKIKNNRE